MDFAPPFCLILALGLCSYFLGNAASGTCEVPSFPSLGGTDFGGFLSNTQYIIPTMNFARCGVIADWTIVGIGGGGGGDRDRIIELQLFRPDPTRSTVFTKVTSSVVTTHVDQVVRTHTFTSIGFTFSPGDVLGFYYPNIVNFFEVRRTNSFSTHSVLTSATSPTASVVTLTATATSVPLMSVSVSCTECPRSTTILPASSEPVEPSSSLNPISPSSSSTAMSTSSAVSCTECPRSNTITGAPPVSQSGVQTTIFPSSSGTASAIITPTSSIGISTPLNTADPSGSDIPVGVPIAVVLVLFILAVVVGVVIIVIVIVSVRRKNTREVSLRAVYESPLDHSYDTIKPVPLHPYNTVQTIDPIDYSIPRSNVTISKSSTSATSPGGGIASPYLCPVNRQSEYETPVSMYKYSEPQLALSEIEPEYHEYQDMEHSVTKESLPPIPVPLPSFTLYEAVPTREQRQGTKASTIASGVAPSIPYAQPLIHHSYHTLQVETPSSQAKLIVDTIYNMSHCNRESYMAPSSKEEEIYAQMAQWGYQEIPRASVTLSEKLGEGQFGEVYKAELKVSKERSLDVAVKLVKKGSPTEERTKLLQEAANLGQFKHRHVVRLIGVVTLGEPKMMVMELLSGGDLQVHLKKVHKDPSQLSSPDLPSLLLQFCKQVADGLACLSRKSFVHRDIAARNILLDKDLNCKISDFGMTRLTVESDYYFLERKGTKIPVKWTSPEALLYKKYSTSSDVWSYGMLMYEIWSLGHKPFEDKTLQEIVECFKSRNYCLPPPPGCPRAVYEVMVKCWNPNHNNRPSASDISGEFCKSERILLSWKKEDIVSPSAQVLGGPLSKGEELYEDLQFLYRENPEM